MDQLSESEKYREALENDPTDTQAFVSLCRIAERDSDFEYLAELYKYRAQVIADTQEIADLYFKSGEIYLDKLEDMNQGVEALLHGFERDQSHAGIGDRLDEIYRQAEDWEAVTQIIEQRLTALVDSDKHGTKTVIRSDLHQQAGEMWEKVFDDQEKALEHYRRAIELDKTNLLALYGAREIYYAAKKYKNAAKLCDLEARAEKDTDRRVALYRELAHLLHEHLQEPAQAVVALKRALKLGSDNEEVKIELARTIAATPLKEEKRKDHRWASDYLMRSARDASPEESFELAQFALMAMPTNSSALKLIEVYAVELGDPEKLADAYEQVIGTKESLEDQAPVIRRLARLYIQEIDSPEQALEWMKKLESLGKPEDSKAIEQLAKGVAIRASQIPAPSIQPGQPDQAVSLDDQEIDQDAALSELLEEDAAPKTVDEKTPIPSAPPEPAAEPVFESAPSSPAVDEGISAGIPEGVSEEDYIPLLRQTAEKARRSGNEALAEEKMLEILDYVPHDQKATTYLERRFRARKDWVSLRDLLLRSAGSESLPQPVQTVRLREAARISEEELKDNDGAIEAWRVIRTNDPKVRDAGDALTRLLSEAERWEELLEIVEHEAQTTKSRAKRIDAYRRIADINRVRIGNIHAAIESLKKVLELSPDDSKALETLDEIYLTEQQYEELIPLLKRRAELTRNRSEKRNLLFRVAITLGERLNLLDEAYAQAKEILAISPNDDEVLEMMESLDEEGEHWDRLLNTLDLRVKAATEPDIKARLLHKKAMIATRIFQDDKAAIKAFKEVLKLVPDDLVAIDALSEMYSSTGEWEELISVQRKRLDVVEDEHEQAEIHRQIAKILENELDRPDEAMVLWRAVLEIEEDVESLGALSRYYERIEDWSELIDVLERQALFAEDFSTRAEILHKRATVLSDKLGEQEQAAAELKKVMQEVDPTHTPTLKLLCDISVKEGNYAEAADVLEQQISHTEDQEERKNLLAKLGDWSRKELDDLERSMDAYEQALRIDPDDIGVIENLDEIYTELKEWDNLLKLIQERYKLTEEDQEKLDLVMRGARVCEEELGDVNLAWTWLRLAFNALKHLDSTIQLVDEAAQRMELWQELIDEVYGVMTRTETDIEEQVEWWLKIADVFEEKLENSGQALEAVLRAFGLAPENKELLDRVDRLAVDQQNWQRLSVVYGVLVNRATENENKIELLTRYAQVLKEQEGQASQAFDISLKAFELDPKSSDLLEMVEQISEIAERWEDLVRVYDVCSRLADEPVQKASLKMRAVVVLRDKLEDPDGALQHVLDSLRIDPFEEEIASSVWSEVRNLEDDLLTTEQGTYWSRLIELYRKLIEDHRGESDKQVELLIVISRINIEELKDVAAAFESLKEAQQINPKDEDTIDKLEAMAGEHNFWEAIVNHYQDILDETFEMGIAVMTHRRRARILEEELDRADEASEHYWQIIQLDASDQNAYEKLMAYYEKAEKWNELVNVLERQLDNAREDEDKKKILLQIASIWEDKIKNRFEAKDWYEQVLTIWSDDKEAREGLSRLADRDQEEEEEVDEDIRSLISIPAAPPTEEDQESAAAEDSAEEDTAEEEEDAAEAEEDTAEAEEDAAEEEEDTAEEAETETEDDVDDEEVGTDAGTEEEVQTDADVMEEEIEPETEVDDDGENLIEADDLIVGEENLEEEPELDLNDVQEEDDDTAGLLDDEE